MENRGSDSGHVGKRLKELRVSRKLSIRALAERCGLSPNAISLIERGENSPTVSSLHRLAGALEASIVEFFQGASDNRAVFVSAANRMTYRRGTVDMESLGAGLSDQQLEPFLISIEPGNDSQQSVVHPGQEFVYCLEGSAVYSVGDDRYELHPGDSLLLDATVPHRFMNETNTVVRLLVVFQAAENVTMGGRRHLEG